MLQLKQLKVSVPIRGLFNLTNSKNDSEKALLKENVSVPIRGLFNLTDENRNISKLIIIEFPSPLGDYLI